MRIRVISLLLLAGISFSALGLTACGGSSANDSVGAAAFDIINLVLDSQSEKFAIASDSILLAQDAIKLFSTINANQSPSSDVPSGSTQVSILYDKAGVNAQDIYRLKTRSAGIGIILKGGETFESISGRNISIDATKVDKITIVPLQNATTTVTVSSTAGWQNTGIFLERGKQFSMKYVSGVWTTNKISVANSDAAGQPPHSPNGIVCNCGEPVSGYSTQALIGKVGGGQGYIPLQIGDSFAGVSYANDFLYLRINEADSFLFNNAGSIKLTVQTENLT